MTAHAYYVASDDLKARLIGADVTCADVFQYLDEQQLWLIEHAGGAPAVTPFFVGEADLTSFKQAQAWWPADAPQAHQIGRAHV